MNWVRSCGAQPEWLCHGAFAPADRKSLRPPDGVGINPGLSYSASAQGGRTGPVCIGLKREVRPPLGGGQGNGGRCCATGAAVAFVAVFAALALALALAVAMADWVHSTPG